MMMISFSHFENDSVDVLMSKFFPSMEMLMRIFIAEFVTKLRNVVLCLIHIVNQIPALSSFREKRGIKASKGQTAREENGKKK